jgi:hypothetical protein
MDRRLSVRNNKRAETALYQSQNSTVSSALRSQAMKRKVAGLFKLETVRKEVEEEISVDEYYNDKCKDCHLDISPSIVVEDDMEKQ